MRLETTWVFHAPGWFHTGCMALLSRTLCFAKIAAPKHVQKSRVRPPLLRFSKKLRIGS